MGDSNDKKTTILTEKDALDIAWKYFQQHAQQRVSYFNFFVLFSSLLTTGLMASLNTQFNLPQLGIGMGLMQMLIAFIFLKIDERNKYLTKIGETALIKLESLYECHGAQSLEIQVFSHELDKTSAMRKSVERWNIFGQLSHSQCFKIIYLAYAFAGLIGAMFAIYIATHEHSIKENVAKTKIYFDISSAKAAFKPIQNPLDLPSVGRSLK